MSDLDPAKLNADDPRLTAFALGESEGEEYASIAAAVEADPSLQAAVEGIRATAGQLSAALESEPVPEPGRPVPLEPYRTVRPARIFPFPYWAVAGLAAAACFALILALWDGPLFETAPARNAAELAAMSKNALKAAGAPGAGHHQPGNHIDIQFANTGLAGGDGVPAAQSAAPEQWGFVLPNPPETVPTAATSGPAGSGAAAVAAGGKGQLPAAAADQIASGNFVDAARNPRSAFPVVVDTAGYASVRRALLEGRRPARGAVSIEGLVNYFAYDYAPPKPADKTPFAASLEAASAPWSPSHRLVRIGLKAREAPAGGGVPAIVARGVSVQVDFNPARVQAYRLIGYEDGARNGEDDGSGGLVAGDVGAGHAVTALYEVVPAGAAWQPEAATDVVKYQMPVAGDRRSQIASRQLDAAEDGGPRPAARGRKPEAEGMGAELLTVRIRYTAPDAGAEGSSEFPLVDPGTMFADASSDFRFAAAVAGFGMVLRDSPQMATTRLSDILDWAQKAAGTDRDRSRGEFISLVKRAGEILPGQG